jgi:hypothetical protein
VKIRTEQIEALSANAGSQFELQMCEHLAEFAPLESKMLGRERMRAFVREGMKRAAAHKFTQRGPVRFYLDLLVLFGWEFDNDSQFPWAAAVVGDHSPADQMERAERLHAGCVKYQEAAAGPDQQYVKAAFERLKRLRYEDLMLAGADGESACLARLKEIHPEKCAHIGEAPLRKLIREAVAAARAQSITSIPGAVLFVYLAFMMGHGFARDPLLPWLSATLANNELGPPNQRAEKLYARTMLYLDRAF